LKNCETLCKENKHRLEFESEGSGKSHGVVRIVCTRRRNTRIAHTVVKGVPMITEKIARGEVKALRKELNECVKRHDYAEALRTQHIIETLQFVLEWVEDDR